MDSVSTFRHQLSDFTVIVRIELLTSLGQKPIFVRIQQEYTQAWCKTCTPQLQILGLQPFLWLTVEAVYMSCGELRLPRLKDGAGFRRQPSRCRMLLVVNNSLFGYKLHYGLASVYVAL
ncbi:hypothetical protein STEG23_012739 [Scotinomys teguina]